MLLRQVKHFGVGKRERVCVCMRERVCVNSNKVLMKNDGKSPEMLTTARWTWAEMQQPESRSPVSHCLLPLPNVRCGSCEGHGHSLHSFTPSCGGFILPWISLTCRTLFSWHTWRAELSVNPGHVHPGLGGNNVPCYLASACFLASSFSACRERHKWWQCSDLPFIFLFKIKCDY